jgi:8-oxo-dGTP diphosphatase
MAAAIAHDCVGALLVRDGKVLLGRRADDRAWLPGAWDVFGGHVEPGEDGIDALRRELAEELGIAPLTLRDLGVLEDTESGAWRLRVYAVADWRGEARNLRPDEHAELRWCTSVEAAERLASAHPEFAHLVAAAVAASAR